MDDEDLLEGLISRVGRPRHRRPKIPFHPVIYILTGTCRQPAMPRSPLLSKLLRKRETMVQWKMRTKLVSELGADGHISGSNNAGSALTSNQSEHSNCVDLVKGSKIEDSTSTHSTLGKSILKKDAHPSLIYPIGTTAATFKPT